ncbi:hypothetical protein TrRE_jg1930, partial [Triparma retinervis]
SVAPWIIGSLGIACVVQMYGVMLSVRGNYDLSMYRSFHTVPALWRESDAYLLKYRNWAYVDSPARNAYDYQCSEVMNIVVTNATLKESGGAYDLPLDDDGYVEANGVTHVYGKCAGCAISNVKEPGFVFDVGLWERGKGRVPTVHNCFHEMWVEPKFPDGRDDKPDDYLLYSDSPQFPGRFGEYYVDNYPFWEANGHCANSDYWYAEADEDGTRPLSFANIYNETKLRKENGGKKVRGTEYLSPYVSGIHSCTSCPPGFSLVVLGKVNMLEPRCDGVEEGNCRVGGLYHLNVGVCVRTFGEEGERAVEELRGDVRRWYAEKYGGADINVGHTERDRGDMGEELEEEEEGGAGGEEGEEGQGSEVGANKVKVSLERLETLWVATVGLLLLCQIVNVSILFLCGYSLRNILGWSRVYSGKTFKTASDAVGFDLLRLAAAALIAVAYTLEFGVPLDGTTEASTGEGVSNIYRHRHAFVNHMALNSANADISYLGWIRGQNVYRGNPPNGYNCDWEGAHNGERDCSWSDESFLRNGDFFRTNKMFGFAKQDDEAIVYKVQTLNAMVWAGIALVGSFTHRLVLVLRLLGRWIFNRVEDLMLGVYRRGGERDTWCWVGTRRILVAGIVGGVSYGIAKGLHLIGGGGGDDDVEVIKEGDCGEAGVSFEGGHRRLVTSVGFEEPCAEVNVGTTSSGLPFLLFFLVPFVPLAIAVLLQSPSFRTLFGVVELLYMFGFFVAASIQLLDAFAYMGENDGGYISWEMEVYALYYAILPVMSLPVIALKAKRVKDKVPRCCTAPCRLVWSGRT